MKSSSEKRNGETKELAFINRVSTFIDSHHRKITNSLYFVGFCGVFLILRSIRAFSKFNSAAEIPENLINRSVTLRGSIKSVDVGQDHKLTLAVDHKPLIPLPFQSGSNNSSVSVIADGIKAEKGADLGGINYGESIRFKLFKRIDEGKSVSCQILRKRNLFFSQDLCGKLLSEGSASLDLFHVTLSDNPDYRKYYKKLVKAQIRAQKKNRGIWK